MKRGDLVMILENSGPWDKEDFYGRVGEVPHKDYGDIAVAVGDKMVLCKPGKLIRLDAVPLLYEALANLENDDGAIPPHAWMMVQAALDAAKGQPME